MTFNKIKAATDPRGQKRWFDLPIEPATGVIGLEDPVQPAIELRHAGQSNKPYANAVGKRATKNAVKMATRGMSSKEQSEARNEDRRLYSKYVATNWRGIVDDDNNPVEFSEAACLELFNALDDWAFDEIRAFAAQAQNFLPQDAPTPEEVEAQAGK